jgi:hypothetical protein
MRQRAKQWVPAMALLALGACAGPRLGTPNEITQDVVAAVDEERTADAVEIMEAVGRRKDLKDLVFPQLYSAAQMRYENGDPRGAAGILRALAAGYKKATSVRVGLAYSLFLVRAEATKPSPDEVAELATVLDEIDGMATSPPAWVRLARAQNSIDRGDLGAARDAMVLFRQEWDGTPQGLAPYVDDLDRYLSSH